MTGQQEGRVGKGTSRCPVGLQGHSKDTKGENSFPLTYGHKAMSLVEIRIPTYRFQHFEQDSNERRLEEQLDLLEEVRLEAEVRTAANKRRVERCFIKRVRPRAFKVGDLVLKETGTITRDKGKLDP